MLPSTVAIIYGWPPTGVESPNAVKPMCPEFCAETAPSPLLKNSLNLFSNYFAKRWKKISKKQRTCACDEYGAEAERARSLAASAAGPQHGRAAREGRRASGRIQGDKSGWLQPPVDLVPTFLAASGPQL